MQWFCPPLEGAVAKLFNSLSHQKSGELLSSMWSRFCFCFYFIYQHSIIIFTLQKRWFSGRVAVSLPHPRPVHSLWSQTVNSLIVLLRACKARVPHRKQKALQWQRKLQCSATIQLQTEKGAHTHRCCTLTAARADNTERERGRVTVSEDPAGPDRGVGNLNGVGGWVTGSRLFPDCDSHRRSGECVCVCMWVFGGVFLGYPDILQTFVCFLIAEIVGSSSSKEQQLMKMRHNKSCSIV